MLLYYPFLDHYVRVNRFFARLYDAYQARIYRYVYFRVADDQVAEDIASQVFLKAWENLLLPAAYHQGLNADAVEARVVALWREADPDGADLRETMGKLPDRLTAFERRMVALIRALLPQPDLLVYDFLSSGLDAGSAARLYALTQRFHGEKPGRVSVYLCADDAASAKLPADVTLRLG